MLLKAAVAHTQKAVTSPAALASLIGAFITLMPHDALATNLLSDRVERVVDGDTVVLKILGRSRLIGMNTPETVAPAQRSGAPPQCLCALTPRMPEAVSQRVVF